VYVLKGSAPTHIGEVAPKTGLTPALRFYERNALLPPPRRSAGGFRQYAETDIKILRFTRLAQGVGFTLKEVQKLLALRGTRREPCAPVRLRLQKKLLQVRGKLRDLKTLQRELQTALDTCKKELRGENARCSLLSGGKNNRSENAA